MLEPMDAFRLAKHLYPSKGVDGLGIFLSECAHTEAITEWGFPIYTLNTVTANDACIFLREGRCSVYEARPRVCRIYPLTVGDGERGKDFEYFVCQDKDAHHFTDGKISIKDWVYQNFKRDEKNFLLMDWAYAAQLHAMARRAAPEKKRRIIAELLQCRYWNYDLDKPFLQQYQENHAKLLQMLERCVYHEQNAGNNCHPNSHN